VLSRYISHPLSDLLSHSTLTLLDPLTYYPTYSNPRFPQFPLSPSLFLFPKTHTLLRFCTLDFTPTFIHLFFHSSPYDHTMRPSTRIQDLWTCCIMGKTQDLWTRLHLHWYKSLTPLSPLPHVLPLGLSYHHLPNEGISLVFYLIPWTTGIPSQNGEPSSIKQLSKKPDPLPSGFTYEWSPSQ